MKINKIVKVIVFVIIILFFSQIKSNANEDIKVMLDPGHGSYDSGATYGGLLEKDINWKIANRVKEILDSTPGITGILTRQENTNPSLYERGVLATKNGADLLVSFHINSTSRENSASGAEVYVTGDNSLYRYYEASNILGLSILENFRSIGLNSFSETTKIRLSTDGERYSDGYISDYYGIIRNPMYYGIPGILVEHCFINNYNDRTRFLNDDYAINKLAEEDAKAIIKYKDLFKTDKSQNCVNSELKKINVNDKGTHLTGKIVVVDWLYGMQSVPVNTPIIKLVSSDGSDSIWCYVSKIKGNTYYFDTWLSNIKENKKYVIEVSTQNTASIPYNNKMNPNLGSDKVLYDNYIIKNNMLQVDNEKYKGDVTSEITNLNWIQDSKYITGTAVVVEWVNGKSTVPRKMPVIKIKSLDNEYIQNCFVKQIFGNTYYFDICIKNLDLTKEYLFEVSSDNEYNISNNKNCVPKIVNSKQNLGKFGNYIIKVQDKQILFDKYNYKGDMNSELITLSLNKKNDISYLNGEIVIVEWIDGKSTVPSNKPKMRFRSTDGEVDIDVFVTTTGTNTYYFDRFIEGIDTSKEYEFIVESSNENNISQYKKVLVYLNGKFNNKVLGEYKDNIIKLQNNKVIFKMKNEII